jgi:indoleamine 2,3-dioxygenase
MLRRAHAVLARILHFYVHSLPPDAPILIPPPLTTPLLQVSAQLQLPPILTYSDCVLYNWALRNSSIDAAPALDNLSALLLFTGTTDEEEFYLVPARIELRGVEALELMQATMDEMFVGDAIAVRRVTAYLFRISTILHELKSILLSQREGCDPDIFYREIRPWLRGADSDPHARKWVFEGIEDDPRLREPTELSGPSAGQSALIHALDIFLGVDWSTSPSSSTAHPGSAEQSFFIRMRSYMPRHHRAFLAHLSANPRPLRGLVSSSSDLKLTEAYNMAVTALSEFRQAHMTIVALYIMGPARRLRKENELAGRSFEEHVPLRGTGGTELAKFLKGVTERTKEAMIG